MGSSIIGKKEGENNIETKNPTLQIKANTNNNNPNNALPIISEFSLSFNPAKPKKKITIFLNNFFDDTPKDKRNIDNQKNKVINNESISPHSDTNESYHCDELMLGYFENESKKNPSEPEEKNSLFLSRNKNPQNISSKNKKLLYIITKKAVNEFEENNFMNFRTMNKLCSSRKEKEKVHFTINTMETQFSKTLIEKARRDLEQSILNQKKKKQSKINGHSPHFQKRVIQIIPFNEEMSYKVLIKKNKSLNDRKFLFNMLSSISFMRTISKEFAYEQIEDMQYVLIEEGSLIMKQNSIGTHVFFIKRGKIKLCPSTSETQIYETRNAPCVIGERLLINDNIRQWDVYAITQVYAYIIKSKNCINTIKKNIPIEKESSRAFFHKCRVFNLLTDEQKDIAAQYFYKEVFTETKNIINEYDRPNCVFLLLSGYVVDSKSSLSLNKEVIQPGNIFGYSNLVYYQKHLPVCVKCIKQCICLSITYDNIKKIFNDQDDYHIQFRNLIIKSKLKADAFFGEVFSLLDNSILNYFVVKYLSVNEVVINKGTNISEYIYVVLEGDVYEENEPRIKLCEKNSSSVLYAKEVFSGREEKLKFNVIASCDVFIARMSKKTMIDHIGKNFDEAKRAVKIKKYILSTKAFGGYCRYCNFIDSLCNLANEIKYDKENEVVYRENDDADKIYIIVEGEVQITANYLHENDNVITVKKAGDVFGISAFLVLLDKNKITKYVPKIIRNETAISLKPNTKLYSLCRRDYQSIFNDNQKLLFYVTQRLFYFENTFHLKQMYFFKITSNKRRRKYITKKSPFDDQVVYCKIYPKTHFSNEQLLTEVPKTAKYLKALDNPFIVNLLSFTWDLNYLYYLTTFSSGNELSKYIYNNDKFHLNYDIVKFISIQLFIAVKAIHSNHLIHRMINPNNIIVNTHGFIHVVHSIDMGVFPTSKSNAVDISNGDIRFMAPEILYGNYEYGIGVDYWSIGVIMYLLICQQFPFGLSAVDEGDVATSIAMIVNGELSFPHDLINENFKDLMMKLMNKGEEKRVKSWEEVINHPFYRNADIKGIEMLKAPLPLGMELIKPVMNAFKNEKYITFKEMKEQMEKEGF